MLRCEQVVAPDTQQPIRVLELMIEEVPAPLAHGSALALSAAWDAGGGMPHAMCTPPVDHRPPSLSERAASGDSFECEVTDTHPPNAVTANSNSSLPSCDSQSMMPSTRRQRTDAALAGRMWSLETPSCPDVESRRGSGRLPIYDFARHVGHAGHTDFSHGHGHVHVPHMHGAYMGPTEGLQLALLHAAPLVWRRGNMQVRSAVWWRRLRRGRFHVK